MTTFEFRGICYDAGVRYEKDWWSRTRWRLPDVERDLRVIRDELHCNAVSVIATSTQRLAEAGEIASGLGLHTWLQPRPFDLPEPRLLADIAETARVAARLRRASGAAQVGLNIGCEVSTSMAGIVPGRTFVRRSRNLAWAAPLLPWFNRRLRRVLDRAVDVAREYFDGPLTYSSGDWERVDWTRFDYAGLDAYPDATNEWRFEADLTARTAHDTPVLATEVGCCTYRGAAEKGAGGFEVLSGRPDRPLRGRPVRDEQVQADYLDRAFGLFERVGVRGVFVYVFSHPELPHRPDPVRDEDMASFGVVAVSPPRTGDPDEPEHWRQKRAFHTIAKRYAAHAARADHAT